MESGRQEHLVELRRQQRLCHGEALYTVSGSPLEKRPNKDQAADGIKNGMN
jgi:hypothetical protein